MNTPRTASGISWTQALRQLGAAMLEGLTFRLDLASLEFQEEKQRLFSTLFLTLASAFLAFLAFVCVNVLILVLLWDTHKIAAVVSMTVAYLALAIGCALWLRHRLRHAPEPFAATLEELRRDAQSLGGDGV